METLFDQQLDEERVGLTDAVSLLGVCAATIRNWIKHKYLFPDTVGGKLAFDLRQLIELKSKIATGEIKRLNRRANKKESTLSFVPTEYADNTDVVLSVERIADTFRREELDLKSTILSVILRLLEQKGLIGGSRSRDFSSLEIRSRAIKSELEWWFHRAQAISSPAYAILLDRP